jgi:hypothetical protein
MARLYHGFWRQSPPQRFLQLAKISYFLPLLTTSARSEIVTFQHGIVGVEHKQEVWHVALLNHWKSIFSTSDESRNINAIVWSNLSNKTFQLHFNLVCILILTKIGGASGMIKSFPSRFVCSERSPDVGHKHGECISISKHGASPSPSSGLNGRLGRW